MLIDWKLELEFSFGNIVSKQTRNKPRTHKSLKWRLLKMATIEEPIVQWDWYLDITRILSTNQCLHDKYCDTHDNDGAMTSIRFYSAASRDILWRDLKDLIDDQSTSEGR